MGEVTLGWPKLSVYRVATTVGVVLRFVIDGRLSN